MFKRIALALILVLFMASSAFAVAAGTVTQNLSCTGRGETCFLTFTCTGSADDGSFPATATSTAITTAIKGYYLYMIMTNPGAGPPQADYDITLANSAGIDLAGGMLADRHTTTSQWVIPKLDSANNIFGAAPINSALTLTITNNNVVSAVTVVTCVLVKE